VLLGEVRAMEGNDAGTGELPKKRQYAQRLGAEIDVRQDGLALPGCSQHLADFRSAQRCRPSPRAGKAE
jgi:hypothetical protein